MKKADAIEISSDQIHSRLVHIEDRLAGMESILAHVNRAELAGLVREAIGDSPQRKAILRACESPQTLKDLQTLLDLNSTQAVNHHLLPLKRHGLLQHANAVSPVSYEWNPMVSKLSKAAREKLLS